MCEFYIVRKLWLQVRIALLKSVFVKEKNKRIQIFVIWPVDPAAII